jgi:hypothetical protein
VERFGNAGVVPGGQVLRGEREVVAIERLNLKYSRDAHAEYDVNRITDRKTVGQIYAEDGDLSDVISSRPGLLGQRYFNCGLIILSCRPGPFPYCT